MYIVKHIIMQMLSYGNNDTNDNAIKMYVCVHYCVVCVHRCVFCV